MSTANWSSSNRNNITFHIARGTFNSHGSVPDPALNYHHFIYWGWAVPGPIDTAEPQGTFLPQAPFLLQTPWKGALPDEVSLFPKHFMEIFWSLSVWPLTGDQFALGDLTLGCSLQHHSRPPRPHQGKIWFYTLCHWITKPRRVEKPLGETVQLQLGSQISHFGALQPPQPLFSVWTKKSLDYN